MDIILYYQYQYASIHYTTLKHPKGYLSRKPAVFQFHSRSDICNRRSEIVLQRPTETGVYCDALPLSLGRDC